MFILIAQVIYKEGCKLQQLSPIYSPQKKLIILRHTVLGIWEYNEKYYFFCCRKHQNPFPLFVSPSFFLPPTSLIHTNTPVRPHVHTEAIIKSWVINSVWSVPSHCWKEVFWRVLETFPPAGTEFNEQLHWIIIHTAQLSLFELRVNTLILYFLVRGRRPVLVETDSLKSQSCISSMRSVQLIRQGEQLNCVLLLDLYSNNDHHLPRRLRLSVFDLCCLWAVQT